MSELKLEDVKNLEQPSVQDLLNQFKKRHEMNVVDVAEIISKLISTLKLDFDSGRPKIHTIAGGHLGQILGIGKGVVSQYLSVWNMPQESKEFLRTYNLSLINAYEVSRKKGKDEAETIKLQKEIILQKSSNISMSGSERKKDILLHKINEAKLILDSIVSSHKIPIEIFQDTSTIEIKEKTKRYIYNIEQCINYLSPKIQKLPYLRKEVEFCNIMLDNKESRFCGVELTRECLLKQIKSISDEILLLESECKLSHILSLLMMKNELEKNIYGDLNIIV